MRGATGLSPTRRAIDTAPREASRIKRIMVRERRAAAAQPSGIAAPASPAGEREGRPRTPFPHEVGAGVGVGVGGGAGARAFPHFRERWGNKEGG